MKKSAFFLAFCCLLGIFSALLYRQMNTVSNRTYTQALMTYDGVDQVLNNADVVLTGKVVEIEYCDTYDKYAIEVEHTYKGEELDSVVAFNYLYSYSYELQGIEKCGVTHTDYQVGENYLFVLQHISNVYSDKYVILSDVFVHTSDVATASILCETWEDPMAYVNDFKYDDCGKGDELSIDYIQTDNDEEIIAGSPCIVVVSLENLQFSGENVDVFTCKVLRTIKGNVNATPDNQIVIPFFIDTMAVGDVCIACISSANADSYIYTLTSKNSVFDISFLSKIQALTTE